MGNLFELEKPLTAFIGLGRTIFTDLSHAWPLPWVLRPMSPGADCSGGVSTPKILGAKVSELAVRLPAKNGWGY